MTFGPPLSRDGHILIDCAGEPETHAQPPFLLRYSPQLFAKECPEMFHHDPQTNRLSLRPGKWPPWMRKTDGHYTGPKDKTKAWTYCLDCKKRWCDDTSTSTRSTAFLPFRDKASQSNLRPHRRPKPQENASPSVPEDVQEEPPATQPEPEPEDQDDETQHEDCPLPVLDEVEREQDIVVPDLPQVTYPTLEEYQTTWAAKLALHAKPSETKVFNLTGLVPTPIPNLWQVNDFLFPSKPPDLSSQL